MKEIEKGDNHVTFDDKSAFFSHTSGLTLSHFVSSPKDVYFQSDEFDVYNNSKQRKITYNIMLLLFLQCVIIVMTVLTKGYRDYDFIRFASSDSYDDADIK